MKRPHILWCVAAVLLLWAALCTLLGLANRAALWHASDAWREEVWIPLQQLAAAGALNHDAAAPIVGLVPKQASSEEDRRSDIEFRTLHFLTDGVARRAESRFAGQADFTLLNAAICGSMAVTLIVYAVRTRPRLPVT